MMISFRHSAVVALYMILTFAITACNAPETTQTSADIPAVAEETETVEYYSLRPETEKAFGYTHAVRIGDDIKVSGAVSMDDAGTPTAMGDMLQQMKNCYADLDKVLKHYGVHK